MAREYAVTFRLKIDVADETERDNNENTVEGWMGSQPAGSWHRFISDEDTLSDTFKQRIIIYIVCTSPANMSTKRNQLDSNMDSLDGTVCVRYEAVEQDDNFK